MEVLQREVARLTQPLAADAAPARAEVDAAELQFQIECLTAQNVFLNREIVEMAHNRQRQAEESKTRLAAMCVKWVG